MQSIAPPVVTGAIIAACTGLPGAGAAPIANSTQNAEYAQRNAPIEAWQRVPIRQRARSEQSQRNQRTSAIAMTTPITGRGLPGFAAEERKAALVDISTRRGGGIDR